MNWNALGKLTGWLPGAAVGSIVGVIATALYWSNYATRSCQLGTTAIRLECVQTPVGDFTTLAAFGVAGAAVGGIIGAIVSFFQSQSRAAA